MDETVQTDCRMNRAERWLNADKHSPASSARSTKLRGRRMLMSVGVESSH